MTLNLPLSTVNVQFMEVLPVVDERVCSFSCCEPRPVPPEAARPLEKQPRDSSTPV